VTIGQIDVAVLLTVMCIKTAGLDAVLIPGEGLRRATFRITPADPDRVVSTPVTPETANAIVAACRAEYLDELDRSWLNQLEPPSALIVEALQARLLACVAAGGIEGGPTADVFVAYRTPARWQLAVDPSEFWEYSQCAYREEVRTGLRAPYPWPDFDELDWFNEVGPAPLED
jgi:hypothetical protein